MKLKGIDLWAYLDTGSGRNLISKEEIYRLGLKPVSHKSHQIVSVNRTKKESLPVFSETIDSVDHKVSEKKQITIIKTPTLIELKAKYEHLRGKCFTGPQVKSTQFTSYLETTPTARSKQRRCTKFNQRNQSSREPHWFVHGRKDCTDSTCTFSRETSNYEKLYFLDVSGVEDQGEDDQLDVCPEF